MPKAIRMKLLIVGQTTQYYKIKTQDILDCQTIIKILPREVKKPILHNKENKLCRGAT